MTPSQKAVLDYVQSYIADMGYAPTYSEIGAACGLKSKSQVRDRLDALRRDRRINWVHGHARSIVIVKNTCPHCGGPL